MTCMALGMESMKTVSLVNLGVLAVHRKDFGLGLQVRCGR